MVKYGIVFGRWQKAWQCKMFYPGHTENMEEGLRVRDMYVRCWPGSVDIRFHTLDLGTLPLEKFQEQVVSFKTSDYCVAWGRRYRCKEQ